MMTIENPTLPDPKLTLLVYDLDGTLVNSFEDIWVHVNVTMRAHGLPELPFEAVRSYVGDGAQTLIRRCLGNDHQDRFEEVYTFYRQYYNDHPVQHARLYPGVTETLAALRGRAVRQAVLTNKPDEVTRQVCERLGLSGHLDGIWGEQPGQPRKPDARALDAVLEHFGAAPGECLFVGDGPADYAVARAAGVRLAAVSYGLLDRAHLERMQPRPDAIVDEFSELTRLFIPKA